MERIERTLELSADQRKELQAQLTAVHFQASSLARLYARGNSADAEDLVQSAALKAAKRFSTYDPSKPFVNWFLMVLKGVAIEKYKAEQRRNRVIQSESPHTLELRETDDQNPEVLARRSKKKAIIERALEELSTEQAEVIEDFYVHDLLMKEIAIKRGISEDSIRGLLARGKAKLRQVLITMPDIVAILDEPDAQDTP